MLSGMFSGTGLAIDLGTANTLVHVQRQGVVLNEPSVVAIVKDGGQNRILAVGREAKEMLGKTPGNIVAIRPMRDGVIADFDVTQEMIKRFIMKATNRSMLFRSRLLISVPAEIYFYRAKSRARGSFGRRCARSSSDRTAYGRGGGRRLAGARSTWFYDYRHRWWYY